MQFLEFLYNHSSGVALTLPSRTIYGKIERILYKENPIKLIIKTKNGREIASFHDRFTYDRIVGKQKPEIGKNILIYLDHNNNIKYIKIYNLA